MIISSGTKSDLLAFKSYNNQNNAVASIKSEQSCRYVDRGTCNVECIYILHTKKHDIPLLMSFRILIEFLSWKVVLWQPASCVRKRFVLVVTASAVCNVGVGTGPWWSAGNCVSDTAAGAGRPADNWDNASAIIRGAGARFVLHDHVDHIEILSPPIHQMLIDSLKGKWWTLCLQSF